jgi:hypothetical protein
MENFLPSEMEKVRFDYINMMGNCYILMKRFHGDIKREVGVERELYSVKEDSIQLFYPMMVMNILKDAKENKSGSE